MKKCFGFLFLTIVFGLTCSTLAQIESQSVGFGRSKSCLDGFTFLCPDFKKVYKSEVITVSWHDHYYWYGNTNGSWYLAAEEDISISSTADISCSGVTNATGTATVVYTDHDDPNGNVTSTATMTNSGNWVDTSSPPQANWWRSGDLYITGFDSSGNPDFAPDYDPSPIPFDPSMKSVTDSQDTTETTTIMGTYTDTSDPGYVDFNFTKTETLSDEYSTDQLLGGYPNDPDAEWSEGSPGASVSISGDQKDASFSGSRVRIKMVAPKKKTQVPYVITTHFDAVSSGDYPHAAADKSVTNVFYVQGDGKTLKIYPCGRGIPISPPYGTVGSGDCQFYVGGSSGFELLPFNSLTDWKDKPDDDCNLCKQCMANTQSPVNMGSLGMPTWRVSEPYLNLWVTDTPTEYTTSLGEKIGFTMHYKQHDTRPRMIHGQPCFVPVTGWNNNWFSYIHFEGETLFDTNDTAVGISFTNWTATVYNAGGGETDFTAGQAPDSRGGDQLLSLTGVDGLVNAQGFRLVHADGSQDIYSLISSGYQTSYTDSIPAVLDEDDPTNTFLFGVHSPPCTGIGCPPSTWLSIVTTGTDDYTPENVVNFSSPPGSFLWAPTVSPSVNTECLGLVNGQPSADALLTDRIDPYGNTIHLSYSNSPSGQFYLQSLTDYDGKTTTFSYTNGYMSQVSMPYGRTATLQYAAGTDAFLTRVTDAQGMTSTFTYTNDDGAINSTIGDMQTMVTPYGTNSFIYFDADKDSVSKTNNGATRSIFITNPDGSHELYAFYNDATNSAPFGYDSSEVPDVGGLDTGATSDSFGAMYLRNSFYWGRSQCDALPMLTNGDGSTLNALGTTDFLLARMKHWMFESDRSAISSACSMEQEPSPDGVHPGQRTWFLYPNSGDPWVLDSGSAQEPETIARLQPDGNTWYQSFTRDGFGNPGMVTTHFVAPGDIPTTTSTSYSFQTVYYSVDADAGPFSWYASRFSGYSGPDLSLSYSFDFVPLTNSTGGYSVVYPNFSTAYITKGDRVTTLFYSSQEQVSGGIMPNGLTVTNIYGVDGFLSKSIAIETPSTNTYTFADGMPATHTDPLGLTSTYSWDNLDRLTNIAFPDGTSVVNTYTNLNLASQKDRLNHSWSAQYDNMGRRIAFTDRNGNRTLFSYCVCGGLESITDPQMNTLVYGRDYANRIISATYNGAFFRTFTRDSLGRLVHETNNFLQSLDYSYDNLDRLLQTASPQGTVFAASYDAYNLPLVMQNAEGILVTNSWDDSGRHLLEQFYANGMTHSWNYNNGLLTSEYDGVHSTYYTRDKAGQLITVQDANNNYIWFAYGPGGQLIGMTNANNAITLWNFDIYGRMIGKTDANGILTETNGYDANGRLAKHWTPAKGLTQYSYDNNGNTLTVAYSSGPGITSTYDSLDRIATMTDAVGRSAFTYQNFGPFWSALSSEDGPWDSDTMSRTYNANGLPYAYSVDGGWSGSYGYDNMLRLHTFSSPAGTFTYNYANATGRQISNLALPGGSSITYGYDPMGLLTSTALKNSGNSVLDSYGYTYDAVGLRTNVLRTDGTHVGYGYDNIGQLTSATGFESGGTPRFNENFGYTYDPAGNLAQRINDTLNETFTVDRANELTNVMRTTSVMTVTGALTNTPTSLVINSQTANIYADKTFAATNVPLVDGLNTFTNVLTISGTPYTNKLTKNLPLSANLSYDLNGNVIGDGLYGYEYDCANQLTGITQTNKFKSEFVYDGFGRRKIRREYAWTGTWVPTIETHYVYDGMLVIQERDGNDAVKASYTRGLDLSGSSQGAGGVGGLLARTDASGSAFYHADGNGNITALMHSGGTLEAQYLYDSYGNIINKYGSLADVNLYRFSSKEVHVSSGLYYYGFRYYGPNLQRWVNSDPITERGGLNLYEFEGNRPVDNIDLWGLINADRYEEIVRGLPATAMNPFPGQNGILYEPYAGQGGAVNFQAGEGGLEPSFLGESILDAGAGLLALERSPLRLGGCPSDNAYKRMLEAAEEADKGGLTKAGRALQKHGSRPGSVFPRAVGNQAAINQQGQQILDDLLSSQNQVIKPNRFGGNDIFDANTGRGVRYDGNGNMIGFLEP